MSNSLNISLEKQGEYDLIKLSGRIDEDSHFNAITNLNSTAYLFDFENINLINSCGVREWITFLSSLPTGSKIVYRHCPQIMVEQMNMVQGFLPAGAQIESFYAPYFDPDADQEVKVLLKTSEVIGAKAPKKTNAQGIELEFDALEAQYFNFLK